jgi:hypothetical protein
VISNAADHKFTASSRARRVQIATERTALGLLANSISFERKCSPFLEFRIDIAPNSSPVWLSLTGCPGVKEFLSATLSWNGTIAAVKELEPTRVLAVTKLLRGPDWSGVAKCDEFARAIFIQPARDSNRGIGR